MDSKEIKRKKVIIVLKAIVFLLILLGLPAYIYVNHQELISSFTSVSDIENFLLEHKTGGILVYIGAQVLQIIICIIPGQPFQFAAGYVFGPFLALIFSLTGAFIGETISFLLAKLLGHDMIYFFFGKTKAVHYINQFNTKKGYFALFLFYFIPGFPKDMVNYIAGLSNLKWAPFIVITTTARALPMMGSILVGSFTKSQQWFFAALVAVIILVITVISIKNKKKIIETGDKIYEKLNSL